MLRSYFYKLLSSPLFYIGALVTLALSLFSLEKYITSDVLSALTSLIGIASYRKLFVLCAAIPFASNFADEWNSKTTTNCITRKTAVKYACSNIVMCYISSLASVFMGMMIYILIQTIRVPLFDPNNFFGSYAPLIKGGSPMLALTLMVFVFASSCGMWAVMGLTVSAFFPNKYVAIFSPFVFCYIVERFTRNLPDWFSLPVLSRSLLPDNPPFVFLWSNIVFIGISAMCGVIFTLQVKRRVENELS